jgi:hypothetical protein
MRHFSNIMPNFAAYLHLLVDSILSDRFPQEQKIIFQNIWLFRKMFLILQPNIIFFAIV